MQQTKKTEILLSSVWQLIRLSGHMHASTYCLGTRDSKLAGDELTTIDFIT